MTLWGAPFYKSAMPLDARPLLSAVLLAVQVFLPLSASAGMTPEEVKAFEGYKAKAESGDPVAQYNLGGCYDKGLGVARDKVEAVKWWRKAADQGDAKAQDTLGYCYGSGFGVAKDDVQAMSWYRKAAEQGHAMAQLSLGFCYAKGVGVAKDEITAYAYLNLAAGGEAPFARENLAIWEKRMSQNALLLGQQRAKELQKEIETKIAAKTAGK